MLVIDVDQARDLSDRGPVTAELIGMNDLWDIIFTQQPHQEGFRGFGVPMPLKENIKYEPVLVYGPPKPVSNAVHACTHLVDMPPGIPSGLPAVQVLSEKRSKLDIPLAENLVTDLNAAPVQQFLDVPVAQGKRWYCQTACWMMVIEKRKWWGLTSVTNSQPTPIRLKCV